MKIERMAEIETNDIQIGDQIHVSNYTATCQTVTQNRALFLLDQYLDKPMEMNAVDTNNGGYPESDLLDIGRLVIKKEKIMLKDYSHV